MKLDRKAIADSLAVAAAGGVLVLGFLVILPPQLVKDTAAESAAGLEKLRTRLDEASSTTADALADLRGGDS